MGEHHSIVGDKKIAVIGLGYVGLPLARLFATRYAVVGFDINQKRIAELRNGVDSTLEVEDEILQAVLVKDNPVASRAFRQAQCDTSATGLSGAFRQAECDTSATGLSGASRQAECDTSATGLSGAFRQAQCDTSATGLSGASRQAECDTSATELSGAFRQAQCDTSVTEITTGLYCSSELSDIQDCTYYIVTVPTPVDKHNKPDLTPLYKASETVGKVLKKGDVVIYESTVYPGATEEECIPVLERVSGLKFNEDFFAGYSPERINPGDKEHTVEKILKVTSGSTPDVGQKVDALYKSVITAGTHLAPTIKVAEAAKVIENSQRDINIAFVNELAKIFNILDIDTHAVLEAAGTKWNFLPFKPGLVGGHCIGVDPYYLAQKAQEHGYHPEIILAGRRLNDSMGEYVASQVVKTMIKKGINVAEAEVLMLGITFKENCPDVRNTKIVDVVRALEDYGVKVSIYDPWANPAEVKHEYGIDCCADLSEAKVNGTKNTEDQKHKKTKKYDAVVLGVAHKEFLDLNLENLKKDIAVLYDVKGILESSDNKL